MHKTKEARHASLQVSTPLYSVLKMISAAEALEIVLSVSQRLAPVTVPLQDALGKVLAEDIHAPDPLPPCPASVKDGYAVVASDGPGEYPVITESRAGNDGVGITVTSGTIAYVTTGEATQQSGRLGFGITCTSDYNAINTIPAHKVL